MTLKQRLLLGTAALTLAAIGITGALAAGRANDCGAGCSKTECGKACPKGGPCPLGPACPGC